MVRSIGIDQGDREVSIVELDGSYRKTRLLKVSSEVLGLGDVSTRPSMIAEAVRGALDGGMKGPITLGYPCREAVLRTIELPFTGSDSIKKVVKSEIEGEIFTHSVDDMVVDFHEVGPVSSGGTKVMVASVPKVGLRDQLEAFEGRRIDPEQIDLDTMALWRVADWCGAFEADDDAADQSDDADGKPVNAVIDLGARSVKVILTEGSHLVEMRVLRFGDSSVAESVARAHGEREQRRGTRACGVVGAARDALELRVERGGGPALWKGRGAAPGDAAVGGAGDRRDQRAGVGGACAGRQALA